MKPLLYLAVRRFVNAIKRIPRTPRLLLPLLFFALVFGLQIVAFLLAGLSHSGGTPNPLSPRAFIEGGPGALTAAMRGVLLLSVFTAVVTAMGDSNLFFGQSDVDFLFPAPLPRRAVLLFKMLGTYVSLLFPAVYVPFAVGGTTAMEAGTTPLAYWPGMIGAWLFLLTTTNVAQTVLVGRGDEDAEDDTRREKTRRALSFLRGALLIAVIAGVYLLVTGSGGLRGVLRAVNSELASLLMFPIAWASDLFLIAFRGWSLAAAGKLAGLVGLAGLSFALLFSRDRDFYESALDASARRLRMITAVRSGNAGTILSDMAREGKLARGRSVRAFGSGALAIVWKDCISVTRTPLRSWITLLVIAAFPALFSRAFGRAQSQAGVLFWIFLFTLNMSSIFLLSLRDMLRRADITKALPIPPARFLLGETLLGIVQLTLLGWVSLGVMAALGMGRGPLLGVAFFALPALAAALLLVQTCFVLLYPNQGDQAQNLVSGLLSLFASIVALLPGVAVGIALYLLHTGPPLLALGVSVTNLIAAAAALAFATFLWQRFDPTD